MNYTNPMSESSPSFQYHEAYFWLIAIGGAHDAKIMLHTCKEEVEQVVESLIAFVGSPSAVTVQLLGWHTATTYAQAHQFLGVEAGEESTAPWNLELKSLAHKYAATQVYSTDRDFLLVWALFHTKASGGSAFIGRWARSRFYIEGGQVVKDFSELPYTNITAEQWV